MVSVVDNISILNVQTIRLKGLLKMENVNELDNVYKLSSLACAPRLADTASAE